MIFEHEIPKGSSLYFGKSAKKKRDLEASISSLLYANDFEEIVTPNFSYSGHQSIADEKKLITISDVDNNQLALRADSTLDVVRIITKRLGRTTSHRKWFYIQPVFNYPSTEEYQIGCEWIGHNKIIDIISINIKVLNELKIAPFLQISNINIPKLVAKELGIDVLTFKNGEIAALFELNCEWLNALLKVKDLDDLNAAIALSPKSILKELEKLQALAQNIEYDKLIISPLYYGCMKYYDDIYFKAIDGNMTISQGGSYKSEGLKSLGFAIYTDNLLKYLED